MSEQELKDELKQLLDTMDIPRARKKTLDLRWLGRNIYFQNKDNPNIDRAMQIINELLKPQTKKD